MVSLALGAHMPITAVWDRASAIIPRVAHFGAALKLGPVVVFLGVLVGRVLGLGRG